MSAKLEKREEEEEESKGLVMGDWKRWPEEAGSEDRRNFSNGMGYGNSSINDDDEDDPVASRPPGSFTMGLNEEKDRG